jgi:hypothetical protein
MRQIGRERPLDFGIEQGLDQIEPNGIEQRAELAMTVAVPGIPMNAR